VGLGNGSKLERAASERPTMRLHTAGKPQGLQNPIVARVATQPVPLSARKDVALVLPSLDLAGGDLLGYAAVVVTQTVVGYSCATPLVHSVRDIDHLGSGHIVALEPLSGFVRTLYRPESRHNTLFATERCSSNCLMCSQPPIDTDDTSPLTERNLKLIDLMSPPPDYLCITGGEPTLLDERLLRILEKLRDVMPGTYVHMLTNGRRFAWNDFTSRFASVSHPNLSVGIPLYADHAALHDYVVQAKDAFDQTILGLHQLARYGIEIEIRVVLQALTVPRLRDLAEYICRNLTFVDHVSFMGMEHIGYAPRNMSELWIDPVDYQEQLESSVAVLARFGIDARIYNLQLCVLKRSLWKYSKQSISDWKNTYAEVCQDCAVKDQCGGFFHWNTKVQSRGIHPIAASNS
jgi:His-Xaa-Ser system radical SAM maturase HxsC